MNPDLFDEDEFDYEPAPFDWPMVLIGVIAICILATWVLWLNL